MKAAVIFDQSGFFECNAADAMHRRRDIPLAIARRGRMKDEVLVCPFDGIANMRGDIHGPKQKSLDLDLEETQRWPARLRLEV